MDLGFAHNSSSMALKVRGKRNAENEKTREMMMGADLTGIFY